MAAKTKKVKKVFSMDDALIFAHDNGNKHALTQQEITDLGGSKQHLDQLNVLEDFVYTATANYYTKGKEDGLSKKEITALRVPCFQTWRKLLEYVQPEGMTKLRISDYDLDFILGDIKKAVNVEGVGSSYGVAGKKAFRRVLETYIGCMIAQNIILSASELDTIKQYQSACKTIDKCNTKILKLETTLATLKAVVTTAEGDTKKYLETQIDDTKECIKELGEKKDDANKKKRELSTAYKAAKATLKQPIKKKATDAA